ncbi:MAG: type II toxin-antitoxin system HicA family toxin [Terriglobia bacterium]|jgi:predicted RNA binding protein YcfA (HicA-like mRNA interferase family)
MPKLRRVSGEEAIRALERLGFRQVRQRGSHVILKKETAQGAIGCVVPLHRELAIGTLHGILQQAKVAAEEFLEKLQ